MSTLLEQASLVMIPSGYAEDIVYSVIPQSGAGDFSFTRASNGTRVNSAGLVEVCPWNLAEYSEDFLNSYWTKSLATITSNASVAPNGTTTADRLQISNSARGVVLLIDSTTAGTTLTFSVYAKANGQNLLRLFCDQTCTYFQGATIVTLTNEWARYSLTITATQTGAVVFGFDNVSDSTTTCGGTNGTTDCFIWGAQFNIGSTAKPYFPTTDRLNVPRLTYQNGGGGCPSLLLEKQSTNILLYSEQIDNAYWIKYLASITANQAISPDGTQNADLMVSSGADSLVYKTGITAAALSYFVKAKTLSTNSRFHITVDGVGSASWNQDGTLFQVSGGTASNAINCGNGWYRCNFNVTSGSVVNFGITNTTSGNEIYIWGLQNEAGTYPTSYIPTTSSSATRVADACFKTGISSLIGQTEGVFYAEFTMPETQSPSFFSISAGSSANRIIFGYYLGALRYYTNSSTGSFSASGIIDASPVVGQVYRIAVGYKANDFVVYKNGTNTNTLTTFTVPASLTQMDNEGGSGTGQNIYASVKEILLFKTRLSNSEIAQLTGNQNYTINQAYASYGVASESPNCVQP